MAKRICTNALAAPGNVKIAACNFHRQRLRNVPIPYTA